MNIQMNRKDRAALAAKCEIGDAYLYQIFSGIKEPSAQLCVVIERESGGQVTRQELRPDDYWLIWPDLSKEAKEV